MRRIFTLVFLTSAASVLILAQDQRHMEKLLDWAFPTRHSSGISWQQSESVSVELGVRDKYGGLGSFDALFVVTDPDGKKHNARTHVKASEFGTVHFPKDFGTHGRAGDHVWECVVNGAVVLRGRFQFSTTFDVPAGRRGKG